MRASVGDRLIIKGTHIDEPGRDGKIVEVRGADGTPPYVVRWAGSDHDALVFPGPDSEIRHDAVQDASRS